MKFQVVENYEGRITVLDTTDDEADAFKTRDWHRDQWADQVVARNCVYVVKVKEDEA